MRKYFLKQGIFVYIVRAMRKAWNKGEERSVGERGNGKARRSVFKNILSEINERGITCVFYAILVYFMLN